MRDLRQLISCLESVKFTLESLRSLNEKGELKSSRLKTLLATRAQGGLYPDSVEESIKEF